MRIGVLGVCALGLLAAACGTNETQRAATGGLTGLGVGALAGGPLGAVIGGVAGAAGGSLMPEGADQIANNAIGREHRLAESGLRDMGVASGQSARPAMASTAGSGTANARPWSRDTILAAQRELKAEGLYTGRIDGAMGPQMQQALAAYQERHGLQQTAALDRPTLDALNVQPQTSRQVARARGADRAAAQSGSSTAPMLSADEVRGRLQAQGFENITDLRQANENTYTARARKDANTYALQVDGQSGRIVSQQQAAADVNDAGTGTTSPPAGGAGSDGGAASGSR